jgi:glutaredoxin
MRLNSKQIQSEGRFYVAEREVEFHFVHRPFHLYRSEKRLIMLLLADIDPTIASELDADNHVIVFSRPGCGACIFTYRGLDSNGVPVKKVNFNDKDHPVLVAVKARLGIDPDAPIELPVVFTWGRFKWNGADPDAIDETVASVKAAA